MLGNISPEKTSYSTATALKFFLQGAFLQNSLKNYQAKGVYSFKYKLLSKTLIKK